MIIINADYLLNFVIPQGPTGPAGTSDGLKSYGGRYNLTSSVINLTLNSSSVVPLSENVPYKNVTYGTNNMIINQNGVYEINYYANMTASAATTVTMAVR